VSPPSESRDDAETAKRPTTRPARGVVVGLVTFFVSVVILLIPFALRMTRNGKYVVAFAFIGACVGLSIALNAALDAWRGK